MRTQKFVIRSGSDLGRTIAEARSLRGLTQAELAQRTGVERTYLTRLERGHTVQQIDRALRLLRQMGVTVTATMDDGDA